MLGSEFSNHLVEKKFLTLGGASFDVKRRSPCYMRPPVPSRQIVKNDQIRLKLCVVSGYCVYVHFSGVVTDILRTTTFFSNRSGYITARKHHKKSSPQT